MRWGGMEDKEELREDEAEEGLEENDASDSSEPDPEAEREREPAFVDPYDESESASE